MFSLTCCRKKWGFLLTAVATGSVLFTPVETRAQATPPELALQQSHSFLPSEFAFTDDGKILASADEFGITDLWDTSTGDLLRFLPGGVHLASLAFSSDGARLAVGRDDSIELWDWRQGVLIKTLKAPKPGRVVGLAWSTNGRYLAGCNGQATIWDTATYEVTRILSSGPGFGISQLAFSPDRKHAATCGSVLELWNLQSGTRERVLSWESATQLAFSADGVVLSSVRGANIWPWRVSDGKLLRLPSDETRHSPQLVLSGDGRTALALAPPNSATVIDAGGSIPPRPVSGIAIEQSKSSRHELPAKLSRDGSLAALIRQGRNPVSGIWDLKTGQRRFVFLPAVPVPGDPVLAADGSTFAVTYLNQLYLWDFKQSVTPRSTAWPGSRGTPAVLAPNGRILWRRVFDDDYSALVSVDLDQPQLVPHAYSEEDEMAKFTPSPNGLSLQGATKDNKGWGIYSPATGKMDRFTFPSRSLPGFFSSDEITAARISGDGRRLVLWNRLTGETWDTGVDQPGGVASFQFSPDGRYFAVCGHDSGAITIWNVSSHQVLTRLSATGSAEETFAFSPDSRYIAYSKDGQARVWDITAATEIFTAPASPRTTLRFSATGKTLMLSSPQGATQFWSFPEGHLRATIQTLYAPFFGKSQFLKQDWLLYTPEGYYVGAKEMSSAVRWRLGDKLLPLDALASRYQRPDLVLSALQEK